LSISITLLINIFTNSLSTFRLILWKSIRKTIAESYCSTKQLVYIYKLAVETLCGVRTN
jgi:hypothetical protein